MTLFVSFMKTKKKVPEASTGKMVVAAAHISFFFLISWMAEAIRTTVIPILRILIRMIVVPITSLIGTTVVQIRILIRKTGILVL